MRNIDSLIELMSRLRDPVQGYIVPNSKMQTAGSPAPK